MTAMTPPVVVRTTHIQRLIRNGLSLAEACDGAGQTVTQEPGQRPAVTADVLEKAAADLRHAAEELTAERLALLGFAQV